MKVEMPEVSLQVDQAQIKCILDLFARSVCAVNNLPFSYSQQGFGVPGSKTVPTKDMKIVYFNMGFQYSLASTRVPSVSNYFRWTSLRKRYNHPSYTIGHLTQNPRQQLHKRAGR